MGETPFIFLQNKKVGIFIKTKFHMPIKGEYKDISETPDKVFAEGTVGPGFAIEPEEGKVYAPFRGTVSVLFPGGHAVGLKDPKGLEVLIHIGLDTVNMKGEGFTTHVSQNEVVKKGDLLVEFDIEKIKEKADSVMSPVAFSGHESLEVLKSKEKDGRAHLKIEVK